MVSAFTHPDINLLKSSSSVYAFVCSRTGKVSTRDVSSPRRSRVRKGTRQHHISACCARFTLQTSAQESGCCRFILFMMLRLCVSLGEGTSHVLCSTKGHDDQPYFEMGVAGTITISYKIDDVSRNHANRKFCLRVSAVSVAVGSAKW